MIVFSDSQHETEAEAQFKNGVQLLCDKQWKTAYVIFEELLKIKYKPLITEFYLSWSLSEMNQNLKSSQIIRRMIQEEPKFYELLQQSVNQYLNNQENSKNIVFILTKCIDICKYLALCLIQFNQIEDAQKLCDEALDLDKSYINTYYLYSQIIAKLFISEQQRNQLLIQFRTHCLNLQEYLNSSNTQYIMGELLSNQQEYDEALEHFNTALTLEPEFPQCIVSKANSLYELNKYSEALLFVNFTIQIDCKILSAYLLGYKICMDQEEERKALGFIDQAIKNFPQNAELYSKKCGILDTLTSYPQALESVEQALKLDPNNFYYLNQKGDILDSLTQYLEAIKCYDQALRIDNKPLGTIYSNKAAALIRLGMFRSALLCQRNIFQNRFKKFQYLYDKI